MNREPLPQLEGRIKLRDQNCRNCAWYLPEDTVNGFCVEAEEATRSVLWCRKWS